MNLSVNTGLTWNLFRTATRGRKDKYELWRKCKAKLDQTLYEVISEGQITHFIIPKELVTYIAFYLKPKDLLSLSLVHTGFSYLINDEQIWANNFKNKYQVKVTQPTKWKSLFREHYRKANTHRYLRAVSRRHELDKFARTLKGVAKTGDLLLISGVPPKSGWSEPQLIYFVNNRGTVLRCCGRNPIKKEYHKSHDVLKYYSKLFVPGNRAYMFYYRSFCVEVFEDDPIYKFAEPNKNMNIVSLHISENYGKDDGYFIYDCHRNIVHKIN